MKFARLLATSLFLLLTISPAVAVVNVLFAPGVQYDSGGKEANFVVMADLDGDGFPDMVVANTDGVSVLLNNGDGTFQPAVAYGTAGQIAFAVAVADLNGDGIPDLVVTNMCANFPGCTNGGVGVLLGNGDGTFQPAVSYNAGGIETQAIVIGDVNGDGFPDLIVTSNCQLVTCVDGSIYLLPGNGEGTFRKPITVGPSRGGPLAIGDLNGDGKLDLVADDGVLLGNGDGTFTALGGTIGPGSVGYIPGGTVSIALADLNGDGKLDVVVATATGIKVQLGNGDGTLQLPVGFGSGGHWPISVAVADVNFDGKPDVIVANECSALSNGACSGEGVVGVLAGNGDGTFKGAVKYDSGGKDATSVAVADVDQDTRTDLVVSSACGNTVTCPSGLVSVLLNTYTAPVTINVVGAPNPSLLNQSVNFTATLSSSVPIPDGSAVTFLDGATVIGGGTTTSGVTSLSLPFTKFGTHTIKATYAGDIYHNAGSGQVKQVVNRFASTTMVVANPGSSTSGQSVMLTATVSSSAPGGPTGSVTFKFGATLIGSKTLSGGTATVTTTKLPFGTSTITATYNGDTQSAPSSGTTTETVN
jgi:hypothetical protein